MRSFLLVLALALAFAGFVLAVDDPRQQEQCAQPRDEGFTCSAVDPKDCRCSTQKEETSCTNWHGCKFSCEVKGGCQQKRGKTFCRGRNCCTYDASCKDLVINPRIIPTKSPVPAPSKSPTIVCNTPRKGCLSVSTANGCSNFNGCEWTGNECVRGGCNGAREVTPAPVVCPSPPPNGCAALPNLVACTQRSQYPGCCKWKWTSRRGKNRRNWRGYCWINDETWKPLCGDYSGKPDECLNPEKEYKNNKFRKVCAYNSATGICRAPVRPGGRRRRRG